MGHGSDEPPAEPPDAPRPPRIDRPDLIIDLEGRKPSKKAKARLQKLGGYSAGKKSLAELKPPPKGPGAGATSQPSKGKALKLPADRHKYPDACERCGGDVREETVTLTIPAPDGTPRLVFGVPAGVCTQCGEQYLHSTTTEQLDRVLAGPPARHEAVPVWEFHTER